MKQSSASQLSSINRKAIGAWYTPAEIAEFAADWAISKREAIVLDPSCGDGVFLRSAAARLKALGRTSSKVTDQLFGYDINEAAIDGTRRALSELGLSANLATANFFTQSPAGHLADAVVGNPPYIRYQLFRDDDRAAALKAAARAGVLLPQLASAWAPFVVHAASFLKPEGRLALVLPAELLYAGYASAVRSYLLREFSDLTVVAFDESLFPGALEEVVVVLGTKSPRTDATKLNVVRLASFSDLARGHRSVLAAARPRLIPEGQRWHTVLLEEAAVGAAASVMSCKQFVGLGTLGRVDIGVVTGANDFFVVSESTVRERRLPKAVLIRSVSRAAHIQGTRFSELDWTAVASGGDPAYLFVVDRTTLRGPARDYVEHGESLRLPERYKCRNRDPWYQVPYIRTPDLFLTYMSNIAPRLVVNEARACNTNTIHGIFLNDPLLAEPLATAFLNSATLLSVELEGRSYGGGVIKLEPREASKVLVPKMTPTLVRQLHEVEASVDALVRAGNIDEASAKVDSIVLAHVFDRGQLELIRSALSSLRARRLQRGKAKRLPSE